ncbi:hypothetical protein Tco_0910525 [Tanacetum coccineum]|uniref:Uncharacterized protein n=1 Tax=Tanacetum coccineum TaxID=301880 RepID=A0ABQ5CUA6_9ASTR
MSMRIEGCLKINSKTLLLSTEVKGITLKTKTAELKCENKAHIPKGYTQLTLARSTACPTVFLTQMNSYFPFFAQQASMLTTHGLEGGERGEEGRKRPVCKLNEDAMEEIDIRSK